MDALDILNRFSGSEISHEKALRLLRYSRRQQYKSCGKRIWAVSLRIKAKKSRSIRLWIPWCLVSAASWIALRSKKIASQIRAQGVDANSLRELVREVGRHGGGLVVDVEASHGDCVKIHM